MASLSITNTIKAISDDKSLMLFKARAPAGMLFPPLSVIRCILEDGQYIVSDTPDEQYTQLFPV